MTPNITYILDALQKHPALDALLKFIHQPQTDVIHIQGLAGASQAFVGAAVLQKHHQLQVWVGSDKESAAYLLNDLETLLGKDQVAFFPESYKRAYDDERVDNANVLMRTEALNMISKGRIQALVTYPLALGEKVITKEAIEERTLRLEVGDKVDLDFVFDVLIEYEFERDNFVYEPGQFAVRGGIIDVFSFANDLPYRIEFEGDRVQSIRSFDPDSQLSVHNFQFIEIIPNIEQKRAKEIRQSLFSFIPQDSILWIKDIEGAEVQLSKMFEGVKKSYAKLSGTLKHLPPEALYLDEFEFAQDILRFKRVDLGKVSRSVHTIQFDFQPQPPFRKKFDVLLTTLEQYHQAGIHPFLFSDQERQFHRLRDIFEDLQEKSGGRIPAAHLFKPIGFSISAGFLHPDLKIACFTDHEIFERYRRYQLKSSYSKDQSVTLKELTSLQPGDYVTHIDHGVGQFAGLEKMEVNGKMQEVIKLLFKDGDTVFVSIHSLHRIARYSGKEGKEPTLSKIGTATWQNLKAKTKKKVKELAFDLIQLYAKRRAEKGFQFQPDTYLQHELEASFLFEETPDQQKAIHEVKADMEKAYPMDRLVCGDVGFGKTEVAVRAAFKAVADGKQVAVLVPTTILALQHYKTFSARLRDLPCRVDYINRFKTAKSQKETLADVANGRIDILVGTHRLVGSDIKFKDLGLLIIDEEQKFGVAVKDKLKTIKVNVDTLTLTATPIPRTLQFSLLGARDLSVIRTPPPNRYPIVTELRGFNEELIRDAIMFEVGRNGQVYFLHNRVQSIQEVCGMIQRLCPQVSVRYAHGQMDGAKLEEIMLDFIEGDFDVLVSTSIIENGLDVPNANTILINDAHMFGLSDLHQMRGRVGRSNKKAYCYLLAPPFHTLTEEARKRLSAIVEFSDLGSGLNIAMKDLDIRGAGDLLGADQSGFINEIGYETYQQILNEAIQELKETSFKEIFHEELAQKDRNWVEDCAIDTDLEILIPDAYVDDIAERLILYKEMDSLNTEAEISAYALRLQDRFGPLPTPTEALLEAIRLRILAKKLGFEKLILKKGTMIAHFPAKQDAPYYQSYVFTGMLNYLQHNVLDVEMKQKNEKLSMHFASVRSVAAALKIVQEIEQYVAAQNVTAE